MNAVVIKFGVKIVSETNITPNFDKIFTQVCNLLVRKQFNITLLKCNSTFYSQSNKFNISQNNAADKSNLIGLIS